MIDIRNPDELWAVQKAKLKLLFTHLHDDDFFVSIQSSGKKNHVRIVPRSQIPGG